jgi:hypothetical protein
MTVKADPCDPDPRARPLLKSKAKLEPGDADLQKSGLVDVLVVDEADKGIEGFSVSVNGNVFTEKTPLPLGLSLEEGEHVFVVEHRDVGKGCKVVKLKAGSIANVAFQFFHLRETVTQLKPTVVERQRQGAIIVLNALGDDTEILVDRKDWDEKLPDFDDRVGKGSGSIKISSLSVGCYEVEVRRKDWGQLDCGNSMCRIEVKSDKDPGVTAQACDDNGCRTEFRLRARETVTIRAVKAKMLPRKAAKEAARC